MSRFDSIRTPDSDNLTYLQVLTQILYFANTDWYLLNFRAPLIQEAERVGYSVACISPLGPFGEKLQAIGVDWQALPFDRDSRLGMLKSLIRSRRALRDVFRKESPRIVHSFTLTSILLTWMAAPRGAGVFRINAVTGLGYAFTGQSMRHSILRGALRPFIRRALTGKDAWTVVQNATDREFLVREFGLDETRVRLIAGSGVDVDRFRPDENIVDGRPLRVGFVGRLLSDKGIRELVAAAGRVRAQYPDVEFVAAGAPDLGNPAAVSAAEIEAWKAAGDVEFLGQVEDMPGFLNSLDLFVLPSYREGLSRSLIEAGACGLAAVTTDVPGCRDVVADGENGLLVPARDAAALGDAIVRLVEDPEMRRRMGRKARKVVEERFSTERINGETLGVYGEVMKNNGFGVQGSGFRKKR